LTRHLFIAFVVLLSLPLLTCKQDEVAPQIYSPKSIVAEDIGATDVWLHVKVVAPFPNNRIQLLRDNKVIMQTSSTPLDSVLLDSDLLPNHTYRYKLVADVAETIAMQISDPVSIKTLDTTSHDITWTMDTLGDGASSEFFDVAIVGDTLIHAVGQIYFLDSATGWRNPPYNGAIWRSDRWSFYTSTDVGYGWGIGYSVYAFGVNDVWVGNSIPDHWDGNVWKYYGTARGFPITGGARLFGIWGTGDDNLFFVGEHGVIVHGNPLSWQRLSSGTNVSVNDIWGTSDGRGNAFELCAASNIYEISDRRVIQIDPNLNVSRFAGNPPGLIVSVWFRSLYRVFVAGEGVFQIGQEGYSKELAGLPNYFINKIRGTDANDVFVVGDFGLCAHFNGKTWKSYPEAGLIGGRYKSIAVSKHLVAAVGFAGGRAIVLRGTRK